MDEIDFLILDFFGNQSDYIELNEQTITNKLVVSGLNLKESGDNAYYNRIYKLKNDLLIEEKGYNGSDIYKITQKGRDLLAVYNLKKVKEDEKFTQISIVGNNNNVAGETIIIEMMTKKVIE